MDGEILTKCPAKLIHPLIHMYILWYSYFQKNMPLFNCPVLRYPAKLLAAFDVIDIEQKRDLVKEALGEK